MNLPGSTIISAAVEGDVDEAVVRRLIAHAGGQPGPVYVTRGKPTLRKRIDGYNNAAQHEPWLVLVDLDHDADCAPPMLHEWVPAPAPNLCFRIAVREVETWLMADAQTLARYLRVKLRRIHTEPEKLEHPKTAMVDLARRSVRDAIRKDMVPRQKSGRRVGPGYVSRLIEYVREHWQPHAAAEHSESLSRTIHCLQLLVETARRETG